MICVNGAEENILSVRLSEYLEQKGYDTGRIAVEINGEIITKSKYDNVVLKDGDRVEIVSFVGGG
ncbi:MAG: sulfur carrier protein ThiS [Oscillospiraceae bacterium]|nr:sulfur carrier protein ThiS [Oscillospiraceae bacterium]